MIGGTVVHVKALQDKIWVECEEDNRPCKCAIYVDRNSNSEQISPGDSVWWQGGFALWTPYKNRGRPGLKSGKDYDIRIPKIGFSGVKSPQ